MLIRWFCFFSFVFLSCLQAQEEEWEYPLGPIGGTFRMHEAAPYGRVVAVDEGGPGDLAGLQVDDYIAGAFGKSFGYTDGAGISTLQGVIQDLGEAIEQACRFRGGFLELEILRPEVGAMTLNLSLTAADALGPAYPLGNTVSPKSYETACLALHEQVMASGSGSLGYPSAFAGLVLLSHPNFNETTGEKPYRLSIDRLRDYYVSLIDQMKYAPVEAFLYDGSVNPNYQAEESALWNWYLGPGLLFLAEYAEKTGDAAFLPTLQTIAEKVANRIQWWRQPQSKILAPGMTAHGGVKGDYGGSGLNITGVQLMAGLAAAKRTGDVDMTVRPRDGRYFGYADGETLPAGMTPYDDMGGALSVVPAGWEAIDPTLQDKLDFKWLDLQQSQGPKGHISYAYDTGGGFDGGARTTGALLSYYLNLGDGTPTPEDLVTVEALKDCTARFQAIHINNHAHNASGANLVQLAMPFLDSRQRRHLLENWKSFWHLARQPDGSHRYMYTRRFEDPENQRAALKEIYNALPYAVASGRLSFLPGYDTSDWIVDFRTTPAKWLFYDYREIHTSSSELIMDLDVVDGLAAAVPMQDYTVSWSVEQGPAGDEIFSSTSALEPTLTFPASGNYHLLLTVSAVDGSQVVTEPIRVAVSMQAVPVGWRAGVAELATYTRNNTIAGLVGDLEESRCEPIRRREIHQLDFDYVITGASTRTTGSIIAPETGVYRFYIAASKEGQFWLDTGSGLEMLASLSEESDRYQWTAFPSQESVEVTLTAGEAYDFEIFHADTGTDGYCSVGWVRPSNSSIHVIDAGALALPASATAEVIAQPQDYTTTLGDTFEMTFLVRDSGPGLYQWRRNGVAVGVASYLPCLHMFNVGGGHEGDYDCVYTGPGGVIVSETATLDLSDTGEILTGGLWKDAFFNIRWREVERIFEHPDYPYFPKYSVRTSGLEDSVGWNDIAQRSTGWLVPEESGRYRFHLVSDDSSRLFLSYNEYRLPMQEIVDFPDATAENRDAKEWSAGKVSDWIELEAGKRYYMEVLHKAARNSVAHFSVAMQKEGEPDPIDGEGAIDGDLLEYRVGGYYDDTVDEPTDLNPDRLKVKPNVAVSVDVLVNDFSFEELTVVSVSSSLYGSVEVLPDGRSISYTLTSAQFALETLIYTARNTLGEEFTEELLLSGTEREDYGQIVTGGLWQEKYDDTPGTTVNDLLNSVNYLGVGHQSGDLALPEYREDVDHYGQRVEGWIVPEQSGRYRFLLTANDDADVFLSYDSLRAHKRLVMSLSGGVPNKVWNLAEQSDWVNLVAGERYYVEILHKQNTGVGYFSLNWQREGEALPEFDTSITGATFEYQVGGVQEFSLFTAPLAVDDDLAVYPGSVATMDILVNDGSDQALTVVALGAGTYGDVSLGSDGRTITYVSMAGFPQVEEISYTISTPFGLTSSAKIITRPFGRADLSLKSGGVWKEKYPNIPGQAVADLTSHPDFQLTASEHQELGFFEGSDDDSLYGARVTGFLNPKISGNYRFYLTGDDDAELYLSTDSYADNKEGIVNLTSGQVSHRVWSQAQTSEWISLEAGDLYYIELLHKQNLGNGEFSVAWRRDGEPELVDLESHPIGPNVLNYEIGGGYTDIETVGLIATPDEVSVTAGGYAHFNVTQNDLSGSPITSVVITGTPEYGLLTHDGLGEISYLQTSANPQEEVLTYIVTNENGDVDQSMLTIKSLSISDGLVAHYSMDHLVNGYMLDVSGNGRHATVVGGAILSDDAQVGRSLDLNRGANEVGYLLADLTENPIVLDDAVTITFWSKGDADKLPVNATILEGANAAEERMFAVHLPWKTEMIFWDCGNDGTGWDRIRKWDGDEQNYKNGWHFWAFTKNATTDHYEIYLDGVLWYQETGRNRDFAQSITKLTVGTQRSIRNHWSGLVDDLRIYDRRLQSSEISLLQGLSTVAPESGWAEHFLGGENLSGDFNDDGRPDLLDYAVGNDPLTPDTSAYPRSREMGGDAVFQYNRLLGGVEVSPNLYQVGGLLYRVQVSSSLDGNDWHDEAEYFEKANSVTHGENNTETIYLRPSGGMKDEKNLFFRLKLEAP